VNRDKKMIPNSWETERLLIRDAILAQDLTIYNDFTNVVTILVNGTENGNEKAII